MTHMNNMMIIENQIIKDKLAGLLYSFSQLIGKKCDADQLMHYLHSICEFGKKMSEELEKTKQAYLETCLENEDLNYRLVKLSQAKSILALNQESVLNQMKEKLQTGKEVEKMLKDEKERIKTKVETLENNFKVVSDEYDKLRKRVKQAKFRLQDDDTERVCVNCKKFYKEDENFNWSCKVHTSQFGEFWWCCGKTDKNAVGCKLWKHESMENQKEKEEEMKNDKRLYCSVLSM